MSSNFIQDTFTANFDNSKSLKLPSKQCIKLQFFPVNKKNKISPKSLGDVLGYVFYAQYYAEAFYHFPN